MSSFLHTCSFLVLLISYFILPFSIFVFVFYLPFLWHMQCVADYHYFSRLQMIFLEPIFTSL
jgi:hypothetical protein